MIVRENVPLAPYTTFGVGGAARYFAETQTEAEVHDALAFAHKHMLPVHPLGAGSNLLVPDAGVDGLVLGVRLRGIEFSDGLLIAGAGEPWDRVVDAAVASGRYGIENLAGIPGTAGGAAVQNIGAYGAELAPVFAYADAIERATGQARRIERADAGFGYRGSRFKTDPSLIITRIALALPQDAPLATAYPDLARAAALGVPLSTPAEVAQAVRAIRAAKFPGQGGERTAGSFFKNPVISAAHAADLAARHPGLPVFPQEDGSAKVSLAWLLDHALGLKGFRTGSARLYEKQPLVIVADEDARAADVDALARAVAARVTDAFGITLEREVESFGARA